MGYLQLQLLGPFQAWLDGELVTGFASDKVRALLAYLAVESERPHRREKLARLLWELFTESSARQSLRHALYNLRKVTRDEAGQSPHILANRQTVQFNRDSNYELDVTAFQDLLALQPDRRESAPPLKTGSLFCANPCEGVYCALLAS